MSLSSSRGKPPASIETVVDRDTKSPEGFRLAGDRYLAVSADREGWITSEVLRIRLRRSAVVSSRLVLEDLDEAGGQAEI
jgi:hypothetical protein